jgi:hypothetical protein
MTPEFVILVLLVMGWFAGGTIWNIRKGNAVMHWMQGGLPLLGERTTMRWLGSTAVELVIAKAKPPFHQATCIIFLEPRDVPPLWGLTRLQGRRDTLIIRAQLRASPHTDLEAVDRASWSGRELLKRIASERWTVAEPPAQGDLAIYHKTDAALSRAHTLLDLARQSGFSVRRLSVRHTEPHFQLHLAIPPLSASPNDFFQAVRSLGERAVG